jgi:hypothetical protein
MKTPLERITAVMKYYYKQSVNKIYKKLLYEKFRQPTEN